MEWMAFLETISKDNHEEAIRRLWHDWDKTSLDAQIKQVGSPFTSLLDLIARAIISTSLPKPKLDDLESQKRLLTILRSRTSDEGVQTAIDNWLFEISQSLDESERLFDSFSLIQALKDERRDLLIKQIQDFAEQTTDPQYAFWANSRMIDFLPDEKLRYLANAFAATERLSNDLNDYKIYNLISLYPQLEADEQAAHIRRIVDLLYSFEPSYWQIGAIETVLRRFEVSERAELIDMAWKAAQNVPMGRTRAHGFLEFLQILGDEEDSRKTLALDELRTCIDATTGDYALGSVLVASLPFADEALHQQIRSILDKMPLSVYQLPAFYHVTGDIAQARQGMVDLTIKAKDENRHKLLWVLVRLQELLIPEVLGEGVNSPLAGQILELLAFDWKRLR